MRPVALLHTTGLGLLAAVVCLLSSVPANAQAPRVVDIRVEQEGQAVTDRVVEGLIQTPVGEPLSMRDVRETITHLMSLDRYEDVQVFSEPVGDGVRLRYLLFPLHAVDRVEFRGTLGVSEADLRRALLEGYGDAPSAGRAPEVAMGLEAFYRSRGYPNALVTPRVEETHNPDRASMVLVVESGPRAIIRQLTVDRVDGAVGPGAGDRMNVRQGDRYDADTVARELQRYEDGLRAQGYYEARVTHAVEFAPDGSASVVVTVDRGPRVTLAFEGDRLPQSDLERLVPVRAEGSVDEDLLEDSNRAIENYLRARGHRDARVEHSRVERDGELQVRFDITRGPRFIVDSVEFEGNQATAEVDLVQLVQVRAGSPFVQATIDAGVAAIRAEYRARGFTRAAVQVSTSEVSGRQDERIAGDRALQVVFAITEGPRTLVGAVAFLGNSVFSESDLRQMVVTTAGQPYSQADLAVDRERLGLEYRNRGYDAVLVEPLVDLTEEDARANVRFVITEGPQAIVDHIIVVGNRRTSTETIERALLLQPGEPLGYSARIESQQRLVALGLFSRVRIEEVRHPGEARRDILVQVEEAPPTTIGYGGGLEGGTRLRPTGEGGVAEERFEAAPRGFFEIGRRNLWGRNRSVNLFMRASLRARDAVVATATPAELPLTEPSYGFNEYRVLATFREPRIFGTRADMLVTGIFDQAIRSSFNFVTREIRAEVGLRASARYSVAGRYSIKRTSLFDERFTEAETPLIDRLFPRVRMSKVSGSLIRDTRNDVIDAERGRLMLADGEVAARAFGSEVGFVKAFLQGFSYHRLPSTRRIVLALAARVGAAHGFKRAVIERDQSGNPILGDDGRPITQIVADLPASERFFAGGDTTVRGFSLDRLGTSATISATGFPTGGNGSIVLNAELRVTTFRALEVATFVDAGNVFSRARDLSIVDLRPAAGFGVRYRSPVGPVRVDLGFNLDRRELSPGRLERRNVLHISLGQAF